VLFLIASRFCLLANHTPVVYVCHFGCLAPSLSLQLFIWTLSESMRADGSEIVSADGVD
jgi:hypothetical protein